MQHIGLTPARIHAAVGRREMRRFIARSVFAILAALLAGALGGCMSSGFAAASDDAPDTDSDTVTDTDDLAPAPPVRNGGVAAMQPVDPCDHEEPSAFGVTPADADDSVSPVLARLLLESGRPPAGEIRVHEFVSYYQADIAPAPDREIHVLGAVTARGDGALGLDVVVTAGTSFPDRSLNLVLAVDTSDAMAGIRIARVRQCCVALAGALRAGDVASMSSLDGSADPLLAPYTVSGPSDPELIAHCNGIGVSGAADLSTGLENAYALADVSRDGSGLNRIIVFTGGGLAPTVGDVAIADDAAAGGPFEQVVLVGVGIGDPTAAEPYDRAALDALTAAGKGAHLLVDSADEAAAAFGERLSALLGVAVVSPALEILLPPTLAIETLDGVPLTALTGPSGADRLAPGQAIAIHHAVASCDPTALDDAAIVRIAASATDPATDEVVEDVLEAPLGELLAASSAGPSKRDAVVAYALALDAWGTLSPELALDAAEAARDTVSAASAAHPGDPDLAEIGLLLDAHLASL
jgi:hypothetical protein